MANNIVDYVKDNADYANLVEAVKFADLVGTLSTEGLQVFAPENDLFKDANAQYRWNKEYTKNLLLNHVTDVGAVTANSQTVPTKLTGNNITASTNEINKINENVVQPAIKVSPEVVEAEFAVYDINGFLVPTELGEQTLYDGAAPRLATQGVALSNYLATPGNVTTALKNLAAVDGDPLFNDKLGYTVFLPTQDAFQELVNDVVPNGKPKAGVVEFLNEGGLNEALLAHAVQGGAPVDSGKYGSLGPKKNNEITVDLSDLSKATVTIDGVAANILNADPVVFTNGQVHEIDSVRYFPRNTTVEIAETATTTLYDLIASVPNLANELGALAKSTIFAPTNEALEPVVCYDGWSPLGVDNLKKVLQHHVINEERIYSSAVKDLKPSDKVPKPLSNEDITREEIEIAAADVLATNGNIHVVSKVLVPPSLREALPADTIVGIASSATKELAKLVVAAGLDGALSTCPTGTGNKAYTVFAPSDAALDVLSKADLEYLQANNNEKLIQVLTHHVVAAGAPVFSSDSAFLDNGYTTLNGDKVLVTKSGNSVLVGGAGANVITADVRAFNGVVHVIDQILIPEGVVLPSTIPDSSASTTSLSAISTALIGAASYFLAAF